MDLIEPSSVPIQSLIGALVINPNGVEYFITDVRLELGNFKIVVELEDPSDDLYSATVKFEDLSDWKIQLGTVSKLHGRTLK